MRESKKVLSLQELITNYRDLIEAKLREEIKERQKEAKVISPHLMSLLNLVEELAQNGKRLRGLLVILGYLQAGDIESDRKDEVVRAGVALELFHLGLLIQDDVMDRDELRRGVATIHTRYDDRHFGETMAILASDYTFGWTIEILAGLRLPILRVRRALELFGKYFTRVGYGQTLDVLTEVRKGESDEDILQVLKLKSGEYSCVLPLLLGATLGEATPELLEKLEQYGMELGWVFQLRDDWLGEYGKTKRMGKPVGNDKREGKKTFATIYGKARLEQEIAKHLMIGKDLLRGVSPKYRGVMEELLEFMASRDK